MKAYEAVRGFVGRLLVALDCPAALAALFADLVRVLEKTCRQNARPQAGTHALLNDCQRLENRLT